MNLESIFQKYKEKKIDFFFLFFEISWVENIPVVNTVPTPFSGTPFSGHSPFSGHVFAPLKNPLKEELRDFGKI